MSILFVASEVDSFEFAGTWGQTTDANYFDNVYVRTAFAPKNGHVALSPVFPAAADETWLHFEQRYTYVGGALQDRSMSLLSAAGAEILRVRDDAGKSRVEYYNGTSWVLVGTWNHADRRDVFDIRYRNTADGVISLYQNNYLLFEATGDFSALLDVVRLRVYSTSGNDTWWLSQIIVADEPTLGFHASYRQPTAAGTHTAWTGTWDEVDAILPNPALFIASDTVDQRENFLKSIFNVPNGFSVKAVAVTALGRRGATGPQNANLSIRFGSTDYDSSAKPLALGLSPVQAFWHTNPATTLPWVNSDAGSATLEFGVKAAA